LATPVLSGILIGTSYIPFPPGLPCSALCRYGYSGAGKHASETYSWWLNHLFIFTLIGFNWVTYMLHEFAHLDWPVAVLGMIFYGLIAHLYVPLAGVIWFMGSGNSSGPNGFRCG